MKKLKTASKRKNTKDFKIDTTDGTKATEVVIHKGKMFEKKKNKLIFPFKQRYNLDHKISSSYIVTMMFNNGTLKTFVVQTTKSTFMANKKTYFLYYEESWFDISMNQYHLFYHENFAVPINREVEQRGDERFFVVKPENLKPLIDFEYVKILAGNIGLDKALRTLIVLAIITLVIQGIQLLMKSQGG